LRGSGADEGGGKSSAKQQAARCLKRHDDVSLFETGGPVSVKPR
jgi:hypothetical protein